MASFGAAVSEHPLLTHAVGEVIGQVMDAVGEEPDVAMLFVTAPTLGGLDDVASAIRSTLKPKTLVASSAISVIGNRREVEETSGISLWAGRIEGVRSVRLDAKRHADGWTISGFPDGIDDGTLLLVADPFTFPIDGLLNELETRAPELAVLGGMASAATSAGGNRLMLDTAEFASGAVGFVVPSGRAETLVSQGCRPVGRPFTITACDHNLITELGGRPALERLQELLAEADEPTRALLGAGLHLGMVVNEQQLDFRRGDFLIRGVVGVDKETGAIAVGGRVVVGQTVQFQVRDADTAAEDLRELLHGRSAEGALVFTCNGRGSRLFGVPDHDASLIYDNLQAPVAGMFCAGEIGPVGDRNHVHGFTASVALFN
ncbi:MAG: FIST signal transduction protein [Acidimicrobiales bacterium]